MLMVCYTNHALDQFLEGVLTFHQTGVIRVGGRSSSEVLQTYNLHEYTTSSESKRRVKVEMTKCQEAIERASGRLARSKGTILTLNDLQDFAGGMHLKQLRAEEYRFGRSVVQAWLGLKTASPVDVSQEVKPSESMRTENDATGDANDDDEDGVEVDREDRKSVV